VVFANAKDVESHLVRQSSRLDGFVNTIMGIHANAGFRVRDEIRESI